MLSVFGDDPAVQRLLQLRVNTDVTSSKLSNLACRSGCPRDISGDRAGSADWGVLIPLQIRMQVLAGCPHMQTGSSGCEENGVIRRKRSDKELGVIRREQSDKEYGVIRREKWRDKGRTK